MSQRTIIFSSPEDVLNFVRTVEKYPYDMDLESDQMDQLYDSLEALNIDISARICLMKFQSTLQHKQSSGYL